jgi:uncharacterized membrane protein
MTQWMHSGGTVLAAFLASLVEFVEALTIVLAVGVSRGWRISLLGAGAGVTVLALLVLAFGPLLTPQLFPLKWLQISIGVLLLIFSVRWLRKAMLRAAGIIPFHDEAAIFANEVKQLEENAKTGTKHEKLAFLTSFKAVLIEGGEVVFIVVTVGAAETSLVPASIGALAALILVAFLGVALHKPLSRVPENSLKYGVAVILMAFGLFWIGEGIGVKWPEGDLVIPALMAGILAISLIGVGLIRKRSAIFGSPSKS